MYDHYSFPPGFHYDSMQNDDPFVSDSSMETFNAPELTQKLLEYINH
jgi:hypothetical protein